MQQHHYRTSVTPSNMSGGRWMPDAFRRSQTFGRTPVARNRPMTLPSGVTPSFSKAEDLLHRDDVAFHAGDLRDAGDLSGAVAHARLLNDDLDRRRDLLAHRALGQVHAAHRDHRFDTGQRVARRVGVDGRQRSVVAGVHRLQHVQRFLAADLADDDAVGAHTQGVDDAAAAAGSRPCLRRSAAASRAARRAPGAAAVRPRPRS